MSDEHLDDIVLEDSNVNLDGLEFDYMDFNKDSPQSPTFSQTSDQSLVNEDLPQLPALLQTGLVKRKKIERQGGSPVKVFYNITLIDNIEFWVCRHKACIPRTKYIKDGSTSNLCQAKVVVKNNSCEFCIIPESSQTTLIQAFNKTKKYTFSNPKQKKLDNNIAAFIVEELQPFSITQSRALKRIVEGLDAQANVLSNDRLKEIFINSENKILQNIREYALNNNGDPYIGLTLHWINDSFQVKEMIGNISYLPYPHISECLFNKIVEILDNLNLKHITISGTVDNGRNIKSCLESESPKQKQFFLEAQMEMEDWDNFLFVVRDVSMRWNSTFYLLKRLTILKPVMYKYKSFLVEGNENSILQSYEEKELSSNEWEKVTKLVKLLYPYEVVTKKLSGSQYPTLSQAWFVINFIKGKLDCAITNNVDVQKFKTLLHESIKNRFLEPSKPIRLTAFLDPRTKDMQIFTEEEKNHTISEARIEYLELATNYYVDNISDTVPSDIMNADNDIFSDPSATYLQEHSNEQDDDNITN
ncbi:19924_t:CDS:2, partial [Cetraspora pellucida]